MSVLSELALEIREVGEHVISNSQDLFLLLNLKESNMEESLTKIRHGVNIVENILSIVAYLSVVELEKLDWREELTNEVNKIKFSCYGLQTALSKTLENRKPMMLCKKNIRKLLVSIKNAGNRMITISYLLNKKCNECNGIEICPEESESICYENRQTCEQNCPNGFCFEDKEHLPDQRETNCPEYIETFTQSSLTHVENGYEEDNNMPYYIDSQSLNLNSPYSVWNVLKRRFSLTNILTNNPIGDTVRSNDMETKDLNNLNISDEPPTENDVIIDNCSPLELVSADNSTITKNDDITDKQEETLIYSDIIHENDNGHQTTSSTSKIPELTTLNSDLEVDFSTKNTETTESISETPTTESYGSIKWSDSEKSNTLNNELDIDDSPKTTEVTEPITSSSSSESYDSTYSYETTTYSYYETFATESPTTPSYETTTQDMYKLSQDIYQAAQDLSSKSSEISSMSSEISSKSSDISSLVSELNNYENDELSKTIQRITKLTQEINSKTSEISSLSSTMSSLASDISSASSDMPSADRHHVFRTTPWQKMSSKSDDLIISAQGIVTAAQDILTKVTEVISASVDLKVTTTVASMAGQITAKTHRLISEALSIVSKTIELINVIDS